MSVLKPQLHMSAAAAASLLCEDFLGVGCHKMDSKLIDLQSLITAQCSRKTAFYDDDDDGGGVMMMMASTMTMMMMMHNG